jgi:molecular chaperone HscB
MVHSSLNYFELFQLSPEFSVDLSDLKKRYLRLQSVVHPDKLAHRSEAEKRLAMQQSTLVNDAYRVLRSPIERARYLLELQGEQVDWDNSAMLSSEFLQQQIQWREQISEALLSPMPAQALSQIKHQLQTYCQDLEAGVQQDFAAPSGAVSKIVLAVQQLQFMYKLLDNVMQHPLAE